MSFGQTKFAKDSLKPKSKILDLGAGDFENVKELKKLGFECEGVDLETSVDFEKPYHSPNAPFDMVMSNFVLHFLNNKEQLIKTAYDNLTDNGLFYFQDLEFQAITGKMYLTKKQIEKLLKSNGFEITSSEVSRYFDDKEGHKHWHKIIEIKAKKR